MSLLSDTQGRPHTLRALIRTMDRLGGELPGDDLVRWFLPEQSERAGPKNADTRVSQTVGCAVSLGWVEKDGKKYRLTVAAPRATDDFFDCLHASLCTTDKEKDRRILEAFAVVVLQMEKEGSTAWLRTWSDAVFADRIDVVLRGGVETETRLFNDSKLPAWREWIEAVGLAWNSQAGQVLNQLLPDPQPRIARELRHVARATGIDVEIPPDVFRDELGKRMPYLDGGDVLREISERARQPLAPTRFTRTLARALFELEEDKVLTLVSRGDASAHVVHIPSIEPWQGKPVVGIVLHNGAVK